MDDPDPSRSLSFLGQPLPSWVHRREVAIEPGGARPYDESEWRDALVVVEQGEVTLECTRGGSTTFRRGDILWLVDVPVRIMRNLGAEAAVLIAVSRRDPNPPASTSSPGPVGRHPASGRSAGGDEPDARLAPTPASVSWSAIVARRASQAASRRPGSRRPVMPVAMPVRWEADGVIGVATRPHRLVEGHQIDGIEPGRRQLTAGPRGRTQTRR